MVKPEAWFHYFEPFECHVEKMIFSLPWGLHIFWASPESGVIHIRFIRGGTDVGK